MRWIRLIVGEFVLLFASILVFRSAWTLLDEYLGRIKPMAFAYIRNYPYGYSVDSSGSRSEVRTGEKETSLERTLQSTKVGL